ncbi:hypothetical protein KQI52_11390 [bacterium]|nr:hypothetical protein [bacterium]
MLDQRMNLKSAKWIGFGGLTGIVILGALGRFVMAGLSVTLGYPANLSVAGIILVSLLGGVLGAIGGLIAQMLTRMGLIRGRGVFAGMVLFVMSIVLLQAPEPSQPAVEANPQLAVMWLHNGPGVDSEHYPIRLVTLTLAALMYVLYGFVLDRLLREKPEPEEPTPDPDLPA